MTSDDEQYVILMCNHFCRHSYSLHPVKFSIYHKKKFCNKLLPHSYLILHNPDKYFLSLVCQIVTILTIKMRYIVNMLLPQESKNISDNLNKMDDRTAVVTIKSNVIFFNVVKN